MSKGFLNFVSSLINDKQGKLIKDGRSKQSAEIIPQKSEQPAGGDLALIQALMGGQAPTSTKNRSDDNRPRGVGLGYDKSISQAEVEANEQIHKLKKQLQREQNDAATKESMNAARKEQHHDGRGAMISKKGKAMDEKQLILEKKREHKMAKKERQNAKKVTQQQGEKKNEEKADEQKKEAPVERVRIRTKTRSKQKNKKRDNRPIEVKRAKLAERGIII